MKKSTEKAIYSILTPLIFNSKGRRKVWKSRGMGIVVQELLNEKVLMKISGGMGGDLPTPKYQRPISISIFPSFIKA